MDLDSLFIIIFQFMIYSFLGWILEVIYRSAKQRRFVNAGFLFGPFLPIYGIGAITTLLMGCVLNDLHPYINFFIIGIILSVVEYLGGMFSEKLFNLKLWDYKNNKYNVNGRISLLYSFIWALLATAFLYYIHPATDVYIKRIDSNIIAGSSLLFIIYFSIDLTVSIISLKALRNKILYLYDNYINLNNTEISSIIKSFNRLLRAFPDINKYINEKIGYKIKEKLNSLKSEFDNKLQEILIWNKPVDSEYYACANEILNNSEFQRLKDFPHHNSSIYDHVLSVSYIAYQLCRYLKFDYKSATRGALLHDFFLYNWRDHDEPDLSKKKFHGIWHPRIALKNAQKQFTLNEIEKDIIVKHMWPLTPVPPRYKESFIVTFADKYVASREFITEIRKKIKEKQV